MADPLLHDKPIGNPPDAADRRRRALHGSPEPDSEVAAVKAQHAPRRTASEVAADRLTRWAGSTPFLLLHVSWFAAWILWNLGLLRRLGARPFDPFPFGVLTMIVALEAICLTILVLLTQRREEAIAELREEMVLHVLLRTEAEVTKALQLVVGLYARLGQPLASDPELEQMTRPLDTERVAQQLAEQLRQAGEAGHQG